VKQLLSALGNRMLIIDPYKFSSGPDAYTKLLLHCDGADASTTFTDSGVTGHTVTANGNAQLDTAQKKFGTASGLFDGSGDDLTIPDSADWDLGTGDFTIDFWVRFNSLSGEQFLSFRSGVIQFYKESVGHEVVFRGLSGGTQTVQTSGAGLATDTWTHIAVVRQGTGASDFDIYVDGVSKASGQISNDLSGSVQWIIGSENQSSGYINSWIDEFRISKGIARWTTDFTPPTSAY